MLPRVNHSAAVCNAIAFRDGVIVAFFDKSFQKITPYYRKLRSLSRIGD